MIIQRLVQSYTSNNESLNELLFNSACTICGANGGLVLTDETIYNLEKTFKELMLRFGAWNMALSCLHLIILNCANCTYIHVNKLHCLVHIHALHFIGCCPCSDQTGVS